MAIRLRQLPVCPICLRWRSIRITATQEYIDRAMAPIRAAFPPQIVQVMEEQMSGPCTAEVAAFDRFTDFLDVPADERHGL